MTLQDLKTLFRKYVKVVTGGPTGLTRGAGMLTVLDTLAEEIHNLPQPDDLLKKANDWQQVQTFEKGIKLPLGNFIDENGHAYFRQVDVGQRHFTFGRYYSLAKDSIIQWKPDEYINQDGDGDVGLARVSAGVLEVNTSTAGQRATLRVLDVVADGAPTDRNTLVKMAGVLGSLSGLLTTAKTSLVAAINEVLSRLPIPGLGMMLAGNVLGLQQSVANLTLPPFAGIGLISDSDGAVVTGNDFANGYRYTSYLALDPAGGPITFTGNGRPQFSAYYDKDFKFLRAVYAYNTSATDYPAGAAYMRLSFPAAQYAGQTYSLGRLPYARAFLVNGGAQIYPNANGVVDLSNLGSGSGGGVTPQQLEAVRSTVVIGATISGDVALSLTAAGALLPVSTNSTITVPANADVPFAVGTVLELVPTTGAMPLVAAAAGVTILAATGNRGAGQGNPLRLVQLAVDSWLLTGGA